MRRREVDGFWGFLIIVLVLVGAGIGICGCGRGDKLLDPSNESDKPKTTKPISASVAKTTTPYKAAVTLKFFFPDGSPLKLGLDSPRYTAEAAQMISGRKREWGFAANFLDFNGETILHFLNYEKSFNGQYTFRITHHNQEGKMTVIQEWAGFPVNNGSKIYLNLNISVEAERLITNLSTPSFHVSLHNSTPKSSEFIAGSRDVAVTVLRVEYVGRPIPMYGLGLRIYGDLPPWAVFKATVWEGKNKVGEAVFPQGNFGVAMFFKPLIMPKEGRLFTVKVDLADILWPVASEYDGRTFSINYDDKNPDNTFGVDPVTAQLFYSDGSGPTSAPKHIFVVVKP